MLRIRGPLDSWCNELGLEYRRNDAGAADGPPTRCAIGWEQTPGAAAAGRTRRAPRSLTPGRPVSISLFPSPSPPPPKPTNTPRGAPIPDCATPTERPRDQRSLWGGGQGGGLGGTSGSGGPSRPLLSPARPSPALPRGQEKDGWLCGVSGRRTPGLLSTPVGARGVVEAHARGQEAVRTEPVLSGGDPTLIAVEALLLLLEVEVTRLAIRRLPDSSFAFPSSTHTPTHHCIHFPTPHFFHPTSSSFYLHPALPVSHQPHWWYLLSHVAYFFFFFVSVHPLSRSSERASSGTCPHCWSPRW